jgi:hypothetical protein
VGPWIRGIVGELGGEACCPESVHSIGPKDKLTLVVLQGSTGYSVRRLCGDRRTEWSRGGCHGVKELNNKGVVDEIPTVNEDFPSVWSAKIISNMVLLFL